ncbi:MAG: ribokinase [Rhodobacterales bacterium]|nr:ribokinase [Rhodobacterales bacterium]
MTVVVLGIFVADTAYRADRLPRMGETILGRHFALGPGGKGSNQAVAAARAGGRVHLITRIGADPFGAMGHRLWDEAGVHPAVTEDPDSFTGAAFIFLDHATGQNAIIVCPGAAERLDEGDVDRHADLIAGARVFLTQLEQPLAAARRGLQIARAAGVTTILNPAPAMPLPAGLLPLCDIITPNETEAQALTGLPVTTPDQAAAAAAALRAMGARAACITLGPAGALWQDDTGTLRVPGIPMPDVVDTVGAGDAFNGALATALAQGRPPEQALRFANAAAAISVTRPGAASSSPARAEIEALLARQP